jgi:hypothetical protein
MEQKKYAVVIPKKSINITAIERMNRISTLYKMVQMKKLAENASQEEFVSRKRSVGAFVAGWIVCSRGCYASESISRLKKKSRSPLVRV